MSRFPLSQIFLWPYAYFEVQTDKEVVPNTTSIKNREKSVVDLRDNLDYWISGEGRSEAEQRKDAIRVISGDPGSGKSSFAKMYANYRTEQGDKVLFVPLHRLNVQGEFGNEIDVFCRETDNCPTDLMTPESGVPKLLIVLDGLDELSKQGKIGATIANEFVEEVNRKVSARNQSELRLQVIISGRPIAVQNVENKFRSQGQILTILPYFTVERSGENFVGRTEFLKNDLRNMWWRNYGQLTGRDYPELPAQLAGPELFDLTTQPLLNLLLSIVYQHGVPSDADQSINFSEKVNRNMIYRVLLKRVYDRDWDTSQSHKALGDIAFDDFTALLAEMALTAWHGTERTTTVDAVRNQCDKSYLGEELKKYQEKSNDGVGSLFTAFYFRKSDKTEGPEPTFEFTHKSFGEYLTAIRLVDGIKELDEQLSESSTAKRRVNTFSEFDALEDWLCLFGPSSISEDLRPYIENELDMKEKDCLQKWQSTIVSLLNATIAQGMPCEKQLGVSFRGMQTLCSNAERALLIFHSAIACRTGKVSTLAWNTSMTASRFIDQIGSSSVAGHLNHINFDGQSFNFRTLLHPNFRMSSFVGATFAISNLVQSDFSFADLSGAKFYGTNLIASNLQHTIFDSTEMHSIQFGRGARYELTIEAVDFTGSSIDLEEVETKGIPKRLPSGDKPKSGWRKKITAARKMRREKEIEEFEKMTAERED